MKRTWRLLAVIVLILALAATVWGKAAAPITLTVTNAAAAGLSSSQYTASGKYARQAVITFDGDIRVFYDGTSPTATVGHYYYGSGSLVLDSSDDIVNFRCIAVSGPVKVTVTLWF